MDLMQASFRQGSRDGCDHPMYQIVEETIMEAPAADVTLVRHGRWMDGKCTACGWEEPDTVGCDGYELEAWHHARYCPNCGAKMDGGTAC